MLEDESGVPWGEGKGRGGEGPASQAVRSCPLLTLTLRTTSALIIDRSQDRGQGREGDGTEGCT